MWSAIIVLQVLNSYSPLYQATDHDNVITLHKAEHKAH
jgi:hypothetical protein